MRLFGVNIKTHEGSSEKQNQPSLPDTRDFIRQQGESSTSHTGHNHIIDFTRHVATNPYYHQAQGEASRQQDTPSHVIRPEAQRWESTASYPWWQALQPREAQHYPEQPLPNEASSSQQQPQADPHNLLAARLRVLADDIEELGRSKSSAPLHTEHIEKSFVSSNRLPTSYVIDFASASVNHTLQEQGHKRKRDAASSSRVPTTLDSTIYGDGLASQQQAQSDQAGHEQQNEKRDRKQRQKEKAAELGITVAKLQYNQLKDKAAKLCTTAGRLRYDQQKAEAKRQCLTVSELKKQKKAMKDATSTTGQ